jgi:hypothetical protein
MSSLVIWLATFGFTFEWLARTVPTGAIAKNPSERKIGKRSRFLVDYREIIFTSPT